MELAFRRARLWLLSSGLVALVLVSVALMRLDGTQPNENRTFGSQTGPIPGERVSEAEAKSRVAYAVPVLPPGGARNPCTEADSRIERIALWASEEGTAPQLRQVASAYTLGVWMSASPIKLMGPRVTASGELLPVEEAFSSDDYPDELRTSRVRGHVAWVNELSPEFTCERTDQRPSGDPPSDPESHSAPRYFDGSQTGHVMWVENGLMIHLTGPFSAADLVAQAQRIRYLN